MQAVDVIVVGGGIAGLATTAWLAQRGVRVTLLESEPVLASHASGRNAAIFRPLEHEQSTTQLALRSLELLDTLLGLQPLSPHGLLLVARERAALQGLEQNAIATGLAHAWLDAEQLHEHAGVLRGGEARAALHVRDAGVLDIHAMHSALATFARARGAELRTAAPVTRFATEAGRVQGLQLADGTRLHCKSVVLAAGAWNPSLGELAGTPLPLTPIRRHLVQLDVDGDCSALAHADGPVVWRVDDDELYFRPESGGMLASPCDAVVHAPGELPADPGATELLAHKLARTAPPLAHARVRRAWACLRTFAPDRELVVGSDPRAEGLFWLAGLGGRGMAVGVAAAELLAREITGAPDAVPASMRAQRLLPAQD